MKLLKWLFIALGSALFLFVSTAAGLYYLLTRTPHLPPGVTPPPVSEEAAQNLEDKLTSFDQEIKSAQQAGESRQVGLEITEKEINSLIDRELHQIQEKIPLKIQSAQVYFRQEEIKVIAKLDLPGIKPTISADFDPQVLASSENLQDALTNLDLGKLPLPAGIEERIKQSLSQGIKGLDLPIKFEEIKAGEGKLILRGVTKTSPAQSP